MRLQSALTMSEFRGLDDEDAARLIVLEDLAAEAGLVVTDAELVEFLDTHPEPWPQIFFDEEGARGFDNPLARRHGVQAIPYQLVIDREGALAARGVRGSQIEAAVADALGVSNSDVLGALGVPSSIPWPARLLEAALVAPILYLYAGVMTSSWWLLCVCALGAALVLALLEAALHTRRSRSIAAHP